MDLFTYDRSQNQKLAPLADRMRPRTLQEFIGQEPVSYTHLMLPPYV